MSNRIEIEAKYFLENENLLMEIIENENMSEEKYINEIDEYFTDIDSNYIKNRTCLRIRKTNNEQMELTFKGKSKVLSHTYTKTESNINIDISKYNDILNLLSAIGYYSYVKFEKQRKIYTKCESDLVYNIMIDNIKNIRSFIEFEILCESEDISIEVLTLKLNEFIKKFKTLNLTKADLPYRDFVAQTLYKKITKAEKFNCLLLDLDGILINSEKEFFLSFKELIYNEYNYEIQLEEYIENELNKNANLINYLKNIYIIPTYISENEIMNKLYNIYEKRFINILYDNETLINIELLKKLKEKNIKIALVTTCKKKFIDILIETLNSHNLFSCIISREDVKNLKPDSEAYELAIKLMNLTTLECIAVEDSLRGVIAATNANLNVISVDKYSMKKQIYNNVLNLNSFSELALIIINNIDS